jgi:hypothetical protein
VVVSRAFAGAGLERLKSESQKDFFGALGVMDGDFGGLDAVLGIPGSFGSAVLAVGVTVAVAVRRELAAGSVPVTRCRGFAVGKVPRCPVRTCPVGARKAFICVKGCSSRAGRNGAGRSV